jgi:hypothetical protein
MLTMRDHGVEDYAQLRDMDATDVGELAEDDRACLDELGQYLVETDASYRFGIWLLHKHFEPAHGELFVERAIHQPRGTETAPVRRSAFERDLNPIAIRFDDSVSSTVGVIGMEFAERADFGPVSPLSDDDEAVLAGIAERLHAHGKIERFGVRLIRNPLGLSEDELLHETSDSGQRTLRCIVTERDAMPAQTVIETTWRWRVVDGKTEPRAQVECVATCRRAGEGHDIAHLSEREDDFGND